MEKPNSLQKIYNPNRPKNNELFRAIQQYLQMKHPDKRMTATIYCGCHSFVWRAA
ncbi:hypothetical protein JFV29_00345 [Peribacillus sp. TH16]|uniref:hypothetical protein n=1 Tax=Peribacillus sp. TH16 TaxID=2798482 RepID=UPI001911C3A8|nr:hypothetical protein [Peribacillus sp. TH16]MBK5480410.1 hypothetical protein [Peribacillus sp. TH16]